MRTVGIIAECNPFHKGHAYLLEEARRRTGADYVVVALSGDFVQRGTPAILDKRTRARRILENGADLVLELPLYVSCGSAGYFAAGAVRLLESTGVITDLCFGSEGGNTGSLLRAAAELENPGFDARVKESVKQGLSYPAAMTQAAYDCGIRIPEEGSPNDLLALSYCRELLHLDSRMHPLAIRRCESPSASALRTAMLEKTSHDPVRRAPLLTEEDLSGALLHALLFSSTSHLSMERQHSSSGTSTAAFCPPLSCFQDVSPDLADRIEALLPQYTGFDGFCALLKNKSLTYSRVRRALLHILLGLRAEDVRVYQDAGWTGYLRPLGFRKSAAPLLAEIARHSSVPFLSKLSRDSLLLENPFDIMLVQDIRASEFCSLLRQKRAAAAGLPVDASLIKEVSQPLLIVE